MPMWIHSGVDYFWARTNEGAGRHPRRGAPAPSSRVARPPTNHAPDPPMRRPRTLTPEGGLSEIVDLRRHVPRRCAMEVGLLKPLHSLGSRYPRSVRVVERLRGYAILTRMGQSDSPHQSLGKGQVTDRAKGPVLGHRFRRGSTLIPRQVRAGRRVAPGQISRPRATPPGRHPRR
jgi:hypothetical protein